MPLKFNNQQLHTMEDSFFTDPLKPRLIGCDNDGNIKVMIIDDLYNDPIKSNEQVIEIKSKWMETLIIPSAASGFGKSMHSLNMSFQLSARKAKAMRKAFKKWDNTPTPYKFFGVSYKNLSLKKKLASKFILKTIHKI